MIFADLPMNSAVFADANIFVFYFSRTPFSARIAPR